MSTTTTTAARPRRRTTTPTAAAPTGPGAGITADPATPALDDLSVASLVSNTPASRDRYVDFLRALSIVIVVLWHWVFSITQWSDDGSLVMPNPIGDIPGLWLATWLLQIMPVFFFVGGFANLASFEGVERKGGGATTFIAGRLRRLGKPVGVYLAVWLVGDLAARALLPGYTGVTHWGMVVFVPLWFLGVYTAVVVLAPVTVALHRVGRELTLVAMVAIMVLADLGRFRFGVEALGLLTSAMVWLFAHQLGYFWRDGTLVDGSTRRRWAMVVGGLAALIVLTNLGVYPRSMVSLQGESSNMFPTTTCIAALAVFQVGVVLLLRDRAERWLAGRRPWTATVAVNAVAMTIFTWHMTALAAAIGLYQLLGYELGARADAGWWWQRPLWLLLPGVVLAALLAVFARFELPTARGRRKQTAALAVPATEPAG